MTDQDATGGAGSRNGTAPEEPPTGPDTSTDADRRASGTVDDPQVPADGALSEREETDNEEAVGDNVFGGPGDFGPIEPGRPDAESVLFVLLGILAAVLVVMRLTGTV
ncbi:MAG: hypothetical protein V5A23_07825 [Halobacteriales archaeon]